MSAPDKKRHMAERIAGLDVKSSFRDIRDGIGGGGALGPEVITDQDFAAALGMMRAPDKEGRRAASKEAVQALETYYGSTLRHEYQLRAAWADKTEHHTDEAVGRVRSRFACAVAIRQLAGVVHTSGDMDDFAYLMNQKPAEFRRLVANVMAWLEELRSDGLACLRKKLAERRAPLDIPKSASTIKSSENCL